MNLGTKTEMKCGCCNKYQAQHKDYRDYDDSLPSMPINVCIYCVELNDVNFDRVLRSNGKLDPKEALGIKNYKLDVSTPLCGYVIVEADCEERAEKRFKAGAGRIIAEEEDLLERGRDEWEIEDVYETDDDEKEEEDDLPTL